MKLDHAMVRINGGISSSAIVRYVLREMPRKLIETIDKGILIGGIANDDSTTETPTVFTALNPIITDISTSGAIYGVEYTAEAGDNIRQTLSSIWQGVLSLNKVKNVWLFVALTLAIWASYFVHYYLTFYCFEATSHLGLSCALVTFIVGSIAVIVPTPNGAGPWHFAVKTMLILYGVADNAALYFVLIVHTVQTLLVVLLGVWAWISLSFTKLKTK